MTGAASAAQPVAPHRTVEPLLMLLLCLCGMLIGLAIDCRSVPPEVLASLCLTSRSMGAMLRAHLAVMPVTNGAMLAGAVLASAMMEKRHRCIRRSDSLRAVLACNLPNAVSAAAMLAGMFAGAQLGSPFATWLGIGSGFTRLTVMMALGMGLGMLLATPFYSSLTPQRAGEAPRHLWRPIADVIARNRHV